MLGQSTLHRPGMKRSNMTAISLANSSFCLFYLFIYLLFIYFKNKNEKCLDLKGAVHRVVAHRYAHVTKHPNQDINIQTTVGGLPISRPPSHSYFAPRGNNSLGFFGVFFGWFVWVFFLCFFRATPEAYGGSQARS